MKDTFKAILIIVLFYFVACSDKKTERYRQLETVDIMSRENKIDSAIYLLDSTGTTLQNKSDSALYILLSIRLKDNLIYDSSTIYLLNKSEKYFYSTNDLKHLAEVYLIKGYYNFLFSDQLDSCQYYFEKGTDLAEQLSDNYLLSKACWYRLHFYLWIGESTQAKDMIEKQGEYAKKANNNQQIAYAALNKATYSKMYGDTANANIDLHDALTLRDYLKPKDIAFIYNGLGELNIGINMESAKIYFEKGLEIDPDSKLSKKNLARIYLYQGNVTEAEKLCKECFDAAWSESRTELLQIQIGCKMAENNLNEVINLQKQIIAEKDSLIKRYQQKKPVVYENAIPKSNIKISLSIIITLSILLIITICITIKLNKKQKETKQQIEDLERHLIATRHELATEKELNKKIKHPGKELYDKIMEGKKCSQWNKHEMVSFLEFYNVLYPEIVEKIDSEYENLSARDKIILILLEIGKPKEEILKTLGLSDSCYQTTMSRIKTKNANT
ncbi:MAG: hypothetical protein IKO56_09225 [Alphaproteobacteria bacterium]|nr:hypothetical protein [Alphaproteobacteria bacterium]